MNNGELIILYRYVLVNQIHETGILCWCQVRNHQTRNMWAFFYLWVLKPKPFLFVSAMSTHFVMDVLTYCYSFCFQLLISSVNKVCITTINTFSDKFNKCLNLAPEQIIFVLSPVHFASLRCFIKFSSPVNICLQILHSNLLHNASTFLM